MMLSNDNNGDITFSFTCQINVTEFTYNNDDDVNGNDNNDRNHGSIGNDADNDYDVNANHDGGSDDDANDDDDNDDTSTQRLADLEVSQTKLLRRHRVTLLDRHPHRHAHPIEVTGVLFVIT